MDGLNGTLSKAAALAELDRPAADHSYRIEAVTADGKRWRNGVRVGAVEEEAVAGRGLDERTPPIEAQRGGHRARRALRAGRRGERELLTITFGGDSPQQPHLEHALTVDVTSAFVPCRGCVAGAEELSLAIAEADSRWNR